MLPHPFLAEKRDIILHGNLLQHYVVFVACLDIIFPIFFEDGEEEEMARNASRLIFLTHENAYSHFPKEASKSNLPYLCSRVSHLSEKPE